MSAVAAEPIPVRVPKQKSSRLGVFFVFSAIRDRTLEKGFDHKRKADVSMPVATGNERSGGEANPCARTKTKKLPFGSFFAFSAVRDRTLEKGFDHKRKADFRRPVSFGE